VRDHFTDSLTRSHEFTTFDRMARFNPRKFLITAHGFGSLAHLPNESIQAPGVDWATMDTGPGAPADTDQTEDETEIERPGSDDSGSDERRKQDKGGSDSSSSKREKFTR